MAFFLFRLICWCAVAWLVIVLLGCKQSTVPRTHAAPPAPAFKVIGYFMPDALPVDSLSLTGLTHVNYAFALPAPSGDTLLPLTDEPTLRRLMQRAHGQGIKVFISIGGWDVGDGGGNDRRFHRMAERPGGRTAFVRSTLQFVTRYGLDGVDLDWEYPDADSPSAAHYLALVQELSRALHAQNKRLTAAVVAYGATGEGVRTEAFAAFDWVNLMAYDDDAGNPDVVAHSPYSLALRTLDYWVNQRGLPASKAVLGLPFYAKKERGQFGPGYRQLLTQGASPYDDFWKGSFYNGIVTIDAKTRLARERGCGGVMIWEISLDVPGDYSLLRAINRSEPVAGDGNDLNSIAMKGL